MRRESLLPRIALAGAPLALAACTGASSPSASTSGSGGGATSTGAGGAAAFSCLPAPSCGGDYVGAWTLTAGCAVAAVPLAGCGTFEIPFAHATGSVTFGADGTYHAVLSAGASAPVAIPTTCMGVKSCNQLDSPLVSCSGKPATGCACTGAPVDEAGVYAELGGVLDLTSTGAATLKTVGGWCVQGASIELLFAGSLIVGGARK